MEDRDRRLHRFTARCGWREAEPFTHVLSSESESYAHFMSLSICVDIYGRSRCPKGRHANLSDTDTAADRILVHDLRGVPFRKQMHPLQVALAFDFSADALCQWWRLIIRRPEAIWPTQDTRTKAIVNRFAVAVHSARTLRAITFLPPDRLDLPYSLNSRWDNANNC